MKCLLCGSNLAASEGIIVWLEDDLAECLIRCQHCGYPTKKVLPMNKDEEFRIIYGYAT